ncbi:MAG: DegT/DnrJ/EryC1/StrS aminotransferase family protein [Vicingaceae bacterium]|nr:DegT/DnrJ/EryC1/StrS aminotransferase family protein [Flavobacteriales bacterium]MBQ20797.1 capsular biosynthesis protein [Flavobacteriales bacterium]MDF1674895.1 DegT/DnrJ/EryC1/StrS aminotransferase family protein [Vicingaceae bacterium]|tara:strand:+ start:67086 stop:68300 length:1215 start_codon:yes stop_codon:yes gene_type:complete
MIPFSPPHINQQVIDEVTKVLQSGWITTGPRTKAFEKEITAYCGNKNSLCLNSATAGLEIILRWFGVKEGDEVILPAYTYSATANVVMHCGAKPVFVDVNPHDFNINVAAIEKAITSKTKVIMPVDFGGLPCDFDTINALVSKYKNTFVATTNEQKKLGRILVLSDAAHSFGATYKGKKTGALTDVSVFSFHAVKNLTTGEGGAVALNLPEPFNNDEIYQTLCVKTLHGQNKDALAKTQKGNWKYDIVEAGYKCNMTDIMAAIGQVELARYDSETLPKRKYIFNQYFKALKAYDWAELPVIGNENLSIETSYHLFPLKVKNITEQQRDAIIQEIFNQDVSVNVHFIPVPAMSFYVNLGYNIKNYPITLDNFSREISLPVFYDLTNEQIQTVIKAVVNAVNQIVG